MITEIKGTCIFLGCKRDATKIACGKFEGDDLPEVYCDEHAETISEQDSPLLVEECPNCHCLFGVQP